MLRSIESGGVGGFTKCCRMLFFLLSLMGRIAQAAQRRCSCTKDKTILGFLCFSLLLSMNLFISSTELSLNQNVPNNK